MKEHNFILLFIGFHVIVLLIKINTESQIVKLSYQNQAIKKEKINYKKKLEELTNELHLLQNPNKIKEYAEKTLNFKSLKIHSIKRIGNSC